MDFLTEIDTKPKLVEWIKKQLGYPTINLEIEDSTIMDNVNDALQYFYRYSGETRYRGALVASLSAGINTYIVPDEVINVIDFDTTLTYGTGVTMLFTAENLLYNEGLLALSSPMEIVSWELAQQYLGSVKERFQPKFFVDFNKYKKLLTFTPKPTRDLIGILNVYTYWSHNSTSAIFNEIWIKKYSLALTKIVLGQTWAKYSGMQIPGGAQLNGSELKNEGITERDFLREDIMLTESEPLGYFIL